MGIENVKKSNNNNNNNNSKKLLLFGGGGNSPLKALEKKKKKKTESLGIEPTIISNMAFILFCIVSANEKVKMGEA